MNFGYDHTNWPIVVLTADGSPKKESEIKSLLDGWSLIYQTSQQKREKFRFIIDVRQVTQIDIKYIMMIAKFLIKNKKLTETWMDRTAVLVSSNSIKLLIKFVFTFYKPVRPFKVFNHEEVRKSFDWVTSDCPGDSEEDINRLKEKIPLKHSNINFNDDEDTDVDDSE